jgi:hypothetical protein
VQEVCLDKQIQGHLEIEMEMKLQGIWEIFLGAREDVTATP